MHSLNTSVAYLPEILLSVSKLSWFEMLCSLICVCLLMAYYVYAPIVLDTLFQSSKMVTLLSALLFLAVLGSFVQIVFKTSIVEVLEEARLLF